MPDEVPHTYGSGDLPVEIDRDGAVILSGDSVAILPRLAAGVADALVTDPPYGLEFNGHAWDGAAGFAESMPDVDLSTMTAPEVFEVLRDVVDAMAQGQAVTIAPVHQRLTTQEAADLLGVSRPTVVKLLESGEIPFEQPGRHRRVRLADVLAYRERASVERRGALDRMVEARQAVQKALRIGVAGVFQVMGGQFLDHAAGIHDQHPVAEFGNKVQVVADEDQPNAAFAHQMVEDAQHLVPDRHIKGRGRFISDQDFRVGGQHRGQSRGGRRRDRNRWLGRLPGQRQRSRRPQADPRPGESGGNHPALSQPGHGGPDDTLRG